jgi:hypothetical protein
MELSLFRESTNYADIQEIPNILRYLFYLTYYRVYNNPQLVLILGQINSVYTIPRCISNIHFNIIHPLGMFAVWLL